MEDRSSTNANNSSEHRRRRNEISAFAALALGDINSDDANRFGSINLTSTSASSNSRNNNHNEHQQQNNNADNNHNTTPAATPERQQQQHHTPDNLFTRALRQNEESGSLSGTFAMTRNNDDDGENGNNEFASSGGGGSRNLRAAAAALERTNTNSSPLSSSSNSPQHHRSGNNPNNMTPFMLQQQQQAGVGGGSTISQQQANQYHTIAKDTPMYMAKYVLRRPFFFGGLLPPRVLNEARAICQQERLDHVHGDDNNGDDNIVRGAGGDSNPASTRNSNDDGGEVGTNDDDRSSTIRLDKTRPAVRNLVGALRVYGHDVWEATSVNNSPGLLRDAYNMSSRNLDDSNDNGGESRANSTSQSKLPYGSVTTYAPVWDPQRTEQVVEHCKRMVLDQQQQLNNGDVKSILARASTAPARMLNELIEDDLQASAAVISPTAQSVATAGSTTTPTGAVVGPTAAASPSPRALTPNEQFSAWLRGGGNSNSTNNLNPYNTDTETDDNGSNVDGSSFVGSINHSNSFDFAATATTTSSVGDAASLTGSSAIVVESEAQAFSRLVLGGGGGDDGGGGNVSSTFSPLTFQRIPSLIHHQNDNDSDGSLNFDEARRQVGVNDHLTKAAASLEATGASDNNPLVAGVNGAVEQVGAPDWQTGVIGGGPRSNYSLTHCIPVYGADDTPLPVEGDLGTHETKDEQERTNELKRTQEWIKQYVPPNVFGSVACPNPALTVDDVSHYQERQKQTATSNNTAMTIMSSSPPSNAGGPSHAGTNNNINTITTSSGGGGTSGAADSISLPSLQQQQHPPLPPRGNASISSHQSSRVRSAGGNSSRNQSLGRPRSLASSAASPGGGIIAESSATLPTRYGWWSSTPIDEYAIMDEKDNDDNPRLELPPLHHSALASNRLISQLKPAAEDLWKQNSPLSRLPAATSMEECLPYLSDRPPSYRYLQIDTKNVFFGVPEVEPLFCSLAIYNVETIATEGGMASAPIPDPTKCRRVTEVLNFDVVSDEDIAQACQAALWPYHESSPQSKLLGENSPDRFTQTRCGVFPLPSNLQTAHLYAVLVVHKVLSDESNVEVYLKPKSVLDVEKLRKNAAKASSRNGAFLTPFAFGVAPLLQVFGVDNPVVASSRAVQIPLFRYSPDLGDRQIIDHIMVMLYPRAAYNKNNGMVGLPAAMTNRGQAMLVMRNFGYLGLHAIVDRKSSLARNRLVDFTGELQLRRKMEIEVDENDQESDERNHSAFTTITPPWRPDYIAEPTLHGGRNPEYIDGGHEGATSSAVYAQELAPLPLAESPRPLVREEQDIEPFYHTSFCNELLFHPRLLHHAPKSNIVVKAELREIEVNERYNALFAHLPSCGPAIHNNRRGPFLVQSVFTACSPRGSQPNFIDEFKLKLPLDLETPRKGHFAILFTVYSVKISSKNKWKRAKKMFSTTSSVSSVDDSGSDNEEETPVTKLPRLEQLGVGILEISSESYRVRENDVHGVEIVYRASLPPREIVEVGEIDATGLVLRRPHKNNAGIPGVDPDESTGVGEDSVAETSVSCDESAISFGGGGTVITDTATRTDVSVASMTDLASIAEDSTSRQQAQSHAPMLLSVRTVLHSTVHTQDKTLSEFLHHEPNTPCPPAPPSSVFLSTLAMGKDFLNDQIQLRKTSGNQEYENMLSRLTIDISRSQLCRLPVLTEHIFRVMPILWRQLLIGSGQPDLAWANPGTILPLRIESFASILSLFGAMMLYMSKGGTTLVDGVRKWDAVTLGRVVSLLFDEDALFGDQAREIFDETLFQRDELPSRPKNTSPQKQPKKRGGHRRRNFSLLNDTSKSEDSNAPFDFGSMSLAHDVDPGVVKRCHEASDSDSDPLNLDLSNPASFAEATQPRDEEGNEVKIDSKSDFQSAMRAGSSTGDIAVDKPSPRSSTQGAQTAQAMIQAFGSARGGKRWMTAPSQSLPSIRESDDFESADRKNVEGDASMTVASTSLDDEVVLKTENKAKPKQMRVPKVRKAATLDGSLFDKRSDAFGTLDSTSTSSSVPQSDKEIEIAGAAFLDVLGKSLGVSSNIQSQVGEEKRVGSSHHRKTRSRSSIDWTLIKDSGSSSVSSRGAHGSKHENLSKTPDSDNTMSTLREETDSTICLPNFVDRLCTLFESTDRTARWFPYVYEVLIMQWSSILTEKERKRTSRKRQGSPTREEVDVDENLLQAATRLERLTAASAPMLFEIIRKSIGCRVSMLFSNVLSKDGKSKKPPLVRLDTTLMENLKKIIVMVADACVDSRNFDDRELRSRSFDVNDSIVRFLRDLFSILSPECVSGLIIAYMGRFVSKENKMKSGDSKIGLKYAWEVTKLQLNAVTGLIRFPDFVRVNSPQMLNWGDWWMTAPPSATSTFFDDALSRFEQYSLPKLSSPEPSDDISPGSKFDIHPHWLAEIAADICLLGTEHAEVYIQHRASSLLYEMFWSCSQENVAGVRLDAVASMFVTFLDKVLKRVNFLSSFGSKSQLRKDIMPCVIFVLQSAPPGLLRALWRKLCKRLELRDATNGDTQKATTQPGGHERSGGAHSEEAPDARDMFSLLNLALKTVEYEGSEEQFDGDSASENDETWRREFIPAQTCQTPFQPRTNRNSLYSQTPKDEDTEYTSSTSRKWFSHDSSLVIVNAGHQIVSELYSTLATSVQGESLLNPAIYSPLRKNTGMKPHTCSMAIDISDVIAFVRAACSLYLHALALRQSDIVIVRTITLSAEIIKMFGIRTFLEAVGETLQHWARVTAFHCGARRASVRVEATDLLELMLRSTWECYGSFFRVRVPLFAVFTEVMERIATTAESRYYRVQRQKGMSSEPFTPVGAEASLVPLWRTLDRIQTQPASQNTAFRGALVRMAGKMKILYRAYIAARVLSYIQGWQESGEEERSRNRDQKTEELLRASRISILLVLNTSAGHSKQFLGFSGTQQHRSRVAHFEAVEDALMEAADVFSATELPEHRILWLKMLARFHETQNKPAEEASCHFQIHVTYQLAAPLHRSLWSSTAFLPWTGHMPDVVLDSDSPIMYTDFGSDYEEGSLQYGREMGSSNSFRGIFYRVANSIALENFNLEDGISKTLHCGITLPNEHKTPTPWISLREMEDRMVREAEKAGELFLKAGIVESSRLSWNLATTYYADKFNYGKLSSVYRNLANTVVSKVPPVDTSLPQEVSATLGRFYKVWFHGGAPDELSGIEFVYRSEGHIRLEKFGDALKHVIKSIIPDNTPIHLLLDGRTETRVEDTNESQGFSRISTTLEPVRIKVTPLRPHFGLNCRRGLPEWFHRYVEEADLGASDGKSPNRLVTARQNNALSENSSQVRNHRHRQHAPSFSASVFSSTGSSSGLHHSLMRAGPVNVNDVNNAHKNGQYASPVNGELAGVDKFCFLQPKDRSTRSNDWWKQREGTVWEKSLKVTQLQVNQKFPASVSRQAVVHRLVYSQSPLEAGVEAVCQWCAVLFRTAVATSGMSVLRTNTDAGIGTDAAKVVADAIHSSHVKEIGTNFLKPITTVVEDESSSDFLTDYDKLSREEIERLQLKLSKLIVVFIQLLHILIVRNRNILLGVIQQRKKNGEDRFAAHHHPPRSRTTSYGDGATPNRASRGGQNQQEPYSQHRRQGSTGNGSDYGVPAPQPFSARSGGRRAGHESGPPRMEDNRTRSISRVRVPSSDQSYDSGTFGNGNGNNGNSQAANARTDSAIAVQSELQRAFINMIKALHPMIKAVLNAEQEEAPDWLKSCSQDNYFSLRSYDSVDLPITRELWFTALDLSDTKDNGWPGTGEASPPGTNGSDHGSIASRGSDRHMYGYGNF